jgi:hypothetical protein
MIFYDFEVFKHDWIICWLDTETRKMYHIHNDKARFEKFYEHYKNRIWVGYNSRQYDTWIAKAILCDFNPYEMSDWLINKGRKGFEFSKLLNKFPILNYDCSVGFRGLKELEAFMGHDIRESEVPWDIDRPLTEEELKSTLQYCKHDVMECFEVFIETKSEYESHIGLIKEFGLSIDNINKTKAQISAMILGANKVKRDDEFNIKFPDTMQLGKYAWIADWYMDWAKNSRNYEEMELKTDINGVPHTFGIGGLHGSKDNYMGEGYYLMADVASYYPALMIEYGFLSRNVSNPSKYRQIRDERLEMKKKKDPRQAPRKIVLNATFGASKDQYNNLYDPLQANNICIAGQLLLVDLLDKLDGKCELIQSNTDGILIKLFTKEDRDAIIKICGEWSKRTRMDLEFEDVTKVVQRDVNNYIIVGANGKPKRKGAVVKELNKLDYDLPIVNKAVVDYFLYGTPVEKTINECNELIQFQKVTKISDKYEYAHHNGKIVHGKVQRCFASKDPNDGTLYKKSKKKEGLDKTPSTPEQCFIDNGDIIGKTVPDKLDKEWYIQVAKERIDKFI